MNAAAANTFPLSSAPNGSVIEGTAGSQRLRLTDKDVSGPDRLSYLHDFVARRFAGLQFTPRDGRTIEFNLAYRQLDDRTVIGSAKYSPVRGERTQELTEDGRSNYMLTIHERAFESKTPQGKTLDIGRSDITIVNESECHTFTLPDTRLMAIVLDERKMARLAPTIRAKAFHHISAEAPGAGLIRSYTQLLLAEDDLDVAAAKLAGDHLHQLAALTIDPKKNDSRRPLEGIGGARLALVKEDIARNLTDHELDIDIVSLRQGVTPRYIQRLFEREGTSFSRFLRDARLNLSKEALEAYDGRTISTVAFDCGFSDLSHFNKAFRQRFGRTPRDVKAYALRALKQ